MQTHKGFERQKNVNSIEQQLIKAFKNTKIISKQQKLKDLNYSCAGRTDKSVSSAGNCIAMNLKIRKNEEKGLIQRLNQFLPDDISIIAFSEVQSDFNAQYNCKYREYHYYIFSEDLDLELMNKAAKQFEGTHNFENFCKMKPSYKKNGTTRTIFKCQVNKLKKDVNQSFMPMAVLVCRANGFLWHQVFQLDQMYVECDQRNWKRRIGVRYY